MLSSRQAYHDPVRVGGVTSRIARRKMQRSARGSSMAATRRIVSGLSLLRCERRGRIRRAEAQSAWPTADPHRRPVRAGRRVRHLSAPHRQGARERVKQPVVVENKAGAGGTIGADSSAKSPPDGYTLLLADVSVVMTFPSLYPTLPIRRRT
jgi:hypothetical protein